MVTWPLVVRVVASMVIPVPDKVLHRREVKVERLPRCACVGRIANGGGLQKAGLTLKRYSVIRLSNLLQKGAAMQRIEVSDELFQRMQKHAQPLVDTAETLLTRFVDAFEKFATDTGVNPKPHPHPLTFTYKNLPNLTHAKLLKASLSGQPRFESTWNSLLDRLIEIAVEREMSVDDIREIPGLNVVVGRRTTDGYHYLSKAGMSVQGQDANRAGRGVLSLAKKLGITIEIEFVWRDKPGASHPGRKARVRYLSRPSLDEND
jgi:hypothetical protein